MGHTLTIEDRQKGGRNAVRAAKASGRFHKLTTEDRRKGGRVTAYKRLAAEVARREAEITVTAPQVLQAFGGTLQEDTPEARADYDKVMSEHPLAPIGEAPPPETPTEPAPLSDDVRAVLDRLRLGGQPTVGFRRHLQGEPLDTAERLGLVKYDSNAMLWRLTVAGLKARERK